MDVKRVLTRIFCIFYAVIVASVTCHSSHLYLTNDSVSYEFIPDVTYATIETRLGLLENEIPLNLTPKVKGFIDYFTIRNRDYTRKAAEDAYFYFPIFEKYLKEYNLPQELKYLSIIESGLNPRAISRANAAGLWQFVPSTGRMFKLHQDWYVDERLDPYEATEAACKYLKELYTYFDDWELALAAYNSGPGRVRTAIRRSGYKQKFWEIYRYLPRETRSYVPQYVAILYALNYGSEHNLFIEEPNFQVNYDTVHVSQYFHIPTFANQLNICVEDLEKLNPQIMWSALPDGVKNFALKVPYDVREKIISERAFLYDSASKVGKKELEFLARNSIGSTFGRERIVYKVRSGDVLGKIAMKYHVRVSDLRKWNRLNGNLIRVGQRLNVWVLPNYYKELKAQPIARSVQPPVNLNGKKVHYVQQGDTLWGISRLYEGLTIDKINQLNNLKNSSIKPGQPLVIGEAN